MDLDRKIGQLFVVAARGRELTPEVVRAVRELHAGGVIWFESTTHDAARLTAELQSMAATPLLVSADFEAGVGMRFTDATWWPPAMALAATGEVAFAEEEARATAREALAIGVHHILAPVADVNVDPRNPVINVRSFGEDPHEVARYVEAFVRGIQSEGALATAKHFPGHGDTRVDSHRALPVLDADRERLERVELVPFRAAIAAGVASIMIGHLAVPALDAAPAPVRAEFENVYGVERSEITRGATVPATVSHAVVDLLRRDLGFQGLVISDAMEMGGLAAHFDPGEAAVRALEAGQDQILYSPDTEAAMVAVRNAVRSGRLKIDEAFERIMHTKSLLPAKRGEGGRRPDEGRAYEIAQRAITLVRGGENLPIRHTKTAVIVTDLPEPNPLEVAARALNPGQLFTVNSESEDLDIDADVLLLALRPLSGAGRIAVPRAAKRLARRNTVAISCGSPYVFRELEAGTCICAYGIQPVMQRAAIAAIRGEFAMTGKLPVTL